MSRVQDGRARTFRVRDPSRTHVAMRRLLLVFAVALTGRAAAAQSSQPPTIVPMPPAAQPPRDAPKGCTCSADLRWVAVRVRRADGTPVPDAVVRVRDARTGRVVHTGNQPVFPGGDEYVVVRDGEVRPTPDAPLALIVEVRRGKERRTARVRVAAQDPCGCHVARVGDPTTVVFP